MQNTDEHWMQLALEQARFAEEHDEVPVGAVLVRGDQLVASAFNHPIELHDPSAHAEILALRRAGEVLQNYRLVDTTLYVTLEPCPMCVGALIHARIRRLVYGAPDPKTGAAGSVFELLQSDRHNHRIEVTGGVLEDDCRDLLQQFFRNKRAK